MLTHAGDASLEPVEVWLRGNVRPVAAAAAGAAAVAAAVVLVMAVMPVSSALRWTAGVAGGAVALGLVGMAAVARRPRLVRDGDRLLVRVSPAAVAEIPLDVVECFFAGSNPLDAAGEPTCGEHAAFRVGTLVVRIAERAADHHRGVTFRPWATWDDGYLVIDGRWCEPLSPVKTRDLGGRLAAAKRALTSRSSGG